MANLIVKETLHPDNDNNIDIYPKTSYDQVEGRPDLTQYQKKSELENDIEELGFSKANNLENGTGTGSLVQKTVSSSGTPYVNEASGSGAVALGKDVKSKGNTTFVTGQKNEAIADTSASFTSGYLNINRGSYNITGGENNANNNSWNLVIGKNNAVSGGRFGIVSGLDNVYTGPSDYYNTAISILGKYLYAQAYQTSDGALLIGQYNRVQNNQGRLFIVGNGTSPDDRKNAFEVLQDGRAKVYGEPVNDEDVVRLKDLKGNVGLYMHNIKLKKGIETYAIQYPSSKNIGVTNLTDLKALLHNNTTTPVMVLDSDNNGVGNAYLSTSTMNIIMWVANGKVSVSLSGYTVTDTIIEL